MGNTSQKARHTSGDDSGPSLTAGRFIDASQYDGDYGYGYGQVQPGYQRRARAATTLSQTDNREKEERLLPTVFKWEGGGKEVFVSGSFNNWKTKIPLAKSDDIQDRDHKTTVNGDFFTIVDLPEGEHQYKFYVDGNWLHNVNEPSTSNNLGTLNNIVTVKKSDFEVFEALALDSVNTSSKSKQTTELSGSPPGDYAQEIPVRAPGGKQSGPPILPPHLLQVILNKDTPAHCEPTLLPEPNHVMLNHLYALSIKDGVMVLSATHRFRKKYVTTLLYKPI
ncbi:5'-AMP-activated protein kinase subunit beta-2-like isoform X3 [Ruditapes philippinarum]|uniref:5'-AMP-activated protein kinase subunit beta-2-like isoform X3 n=1 Tax=Ruditapes philippinarum TaxID=129788 RepID=UPI00295B7246|nr:5'-AMP-activated protein kinase subunit beta-2-like isoform X3 [Ruditapes philippinarum]